jgi:hypothetical protein
VYSSVNRLPTVPNAKPRVEIVAERIRYRQRLNSFLLNGFFTLKSQSPHKVLQITNPRLEGYRAVISNAYIIRPGDELKFTARYVYNGTKPETLLIEQSADGEKQSLIAFFPTKSYIDVTTSVRVGEPKNLTCRALSKPRPGRPLAYIVDMLRLSNELTLTYPVGLLDDRPKPVSEYPVRGADNAVLDIPYSWRVQNTVYPQPVPEGLAFSNLSVEFVSGFVQHEGKYYKDPSTQNTVRIRCRVSNNSAYNLRVEHWGLVVAVLYEDDRHVSQANVSVRFPSFNLDRGQSRDYHIDVNLPTWAYGKVAIAHAMLFHDGATQALRYAGGPLYCFEVYRLRLP